MKKLPVTQHATILDDHRNMLMLSKNVSEFQERNLKKMPFVYLDKIDSFSVEYNFIDKEEMFYAGDIKYDFKFKEGAKNKESDLKALEASIRSIFFTDTIIKFYKDGKLWKFKSTKKTSQKSKKKPSKSM